MTSLAKKSLAGSITMLLLSVLQRGLGFLSTVVLARLLTPEDYGVIAIINLVVFLIDSLSTVGVGQYIIQKTEVDADDLNSAWTINLLLKSVFFALAALAMPFITAFLDKPELLYPMLITLLILPLSAFATPGVYLLHKHLDLKPLFWMNLSARLTVFAITLVLAYVYRNYWALVFGTLFSYFLPAIGTYFIHPFRPKISFSKFHEQWGFSKWIFFNSFVGYIKGQIDMFIISKLYSSENIGGYNMMKNVAKMPEQILIAPLSSTFLSTYLNVKHDRQKLNRVSNISFLGLSALLCPLSALLYLNPLMVINILLGDSWFTYVDIFAVLALTLAVTPLTILTKNYSMAFGSVKPYFYLDLFSVVLSASIYFFIFDKTILYFAYAYLAISLIQALVTIIYFNMKLNMPVCFPIIHTLGLAALAFGLGYLFFPSQTTHLSLTAIGSYIVYFVSFYFTLAVIIYSIKSKIYEYNYVVNTLINNLMHRLTKLKS